MSHTMLTIETTGYGWKVECPACGRVALFERQALHEGRLHDAETVLEYGDTSVGHSWSSSPNVAVRASIR